MSEQSNLASNPFAALFVSPEQAHQYSSSAKDNAVHKIQTEVVAEGKEIISKTEDNNDVTNVIDINKMVEHIFLITLDQEPFPGRPPRCVHLDELQESLKGQTWLDLDCLEQAVFERVMLGDPGIHVITTSGKVPTAAAASEAGEQSPLRYLCQCYIRLQRWQLKSEILSQDAIDKCQAVISLNGRTCFQHPEFLPNLDLTVEVLDILTDTSRDSDEVCNFFQTIAEDIKQNPEERNVYDSFKPILEALKAKVKEFSLSHGVLFTYIDLILFFTRTSCLAETLMQFVQPSDPTIGRTFEDTLFGNVLCISAVVKNEADTEQFFINPSRVSKREHDATEASIHQTIGILNDKMYQIIYNILKLGGVPREQMLNWLGLCVTSNKGRAKVWSRHMGMRLMNQMYCYDGFFLNLCAVMLRLSKPFAQPCGPRLLKVQPTYCLATAGEKEQVRNRNVHVIDFNETGLIPPQEGCENEQPVAEANYNFVSECFYMTHLSLHLGFHVAQQTFLKLNQDLHRVQGVYEEVVRRSGEAGAQNVKVHMDKGMTIFLSLKAGMTEPQLLDLCFNFLVATTTYLVHMATHADSSEFRPVEFPLSETAPQVLTALPELVAENVLDFLLFLRRFKDSLYESVGDDRLEHLMTFILVFMGSPNRMRNPHLRARMAEALEAIMPPKSTQSSLGLSRFHREQLFEKHPLIKHLSATLLHVFVSIEMTGQGVEFEQKFNYRRPMYNVLEFIWDKELHRNAIKRLALEAEEHIEDVNSPLFLRFVNLLINDAIFLLDEALSYMTQIREAQTERDRGDWEQLAKAQRDEKEANYRQLTMLSRFHNIMSNDTIHTLELMTQEIKSIFLHSVLVDRIVAMLNYFLLTLVGPKQKDLKVKDFAEFEFKPQELVSNISQIYLNLGEDKAFCRAVSRDGRSYSHDLFVQAGRVLDRINSPREMIRRLERLAKTIQAMAVQLAEDEEAVGDAPEEFLDPIMGTLMKDPVTLPSSGNIVDRTTIARHILSDQSDPFNRQPLTMDMVVPNTQLKTRIEAWEKEQRSQPRRPKTSAQQPRKSES